jgi:hypothetical protein
MGIAFFSGNIGPTPQAVATLRDALGLVLSDMEENAPAIAPRSDTRSNGEGEPAETKPTEKVPPTEIWSKALSKSRIVTALRLRNTDDLNKHLDAGIYSVQKVGQNRQRWQIRLDTLPDEIRKCLERA